MEIAIASIFVGLAIGLVVGTLGAGSVFAVPVLVYILGQNPHAASVSSLLIALATALTSIVHHARSKHVVWGRGLVYGLISIIGAFVGSRSALLIPGWLLMVLFGLMLLTVAVLMGYKGISLRRKESAAASLVRVPEAGGSVPDAPDAPVSMKAAPTSISIVKVALAALCTGFLTGFFGVGGGFVVVPMLVLVLGLDIKKASGTSLLVMVIASASSLISRIGTNVVIDWQVTILFTVGSAVGGLLGGPLSAKARPSTLTLLFSVLLTVVSVFTLIQNALGN
ncbi:sulfite exporter TauE/SafE family protein [Devriesea agamarum]|uniref:sulfite exporter TauE/SafE family protein n=1 Tax=Devriesea agamarum TaxID=472569 RepID=UPI00071D526B|nr:sulfite exporter TauE/SafE family protein [Devriesea agamarum]